MWTSRIIQTLNIITLDKDVTVIDTPGFAEEDFEEEDKLMYGIIDELKNTVKNVNVFIIILNGEQTSMDGKFESMIRLFGKIFGNQFWNNVLLQTDWTFTERDISTRGENNETKWEIDWDTKLRKTFTDIPVSKIFCYHGILSLFSSKSQTFGLGRTICADTFLADLSAAILVL